MSTGFATMEAGAMLEAASFFLLDGLKSQCCQLLLEQVNASNYAQSLEMATRYQEVIKERRVQRPL